MRIGFFFRHNGVTSLVVSIAVVACGCATSPEAKSARFVAAGKKLLEKNDPGRAILQFRSAAQATPKDAEVRYQLGMAYLAAGDLRNGVASLRKALELNPKHAGAQLRISQLLASSNDPSLLKDVQGRLRALLAEDPANSETLNTLAFTQLKLGEAASATQTLERALEQSPGDATSWMMLARVKMSQGDVKGAEAILLKAVQDNPKSPDAYRILGEFHILQKKTAEAVEEFHRALQIDPKNGPALMVLARLQFTTGHMQEAEDSFRRLATFDGYKGIYAVFLWEAERRDEAIREFEKLAKVNPDDRQSRTRLVVAYRSANRPADADRVLEEAIKKNPKDVDALLQRGETLIERGKYGEAGADLNQVLKMKPQAPEVQWALARLHLAKGETSSYRQKLAETLRLNPFLGQVRLELAGSFLSENQFQAALTLLDEAPESQKGTVAYLVQRNWALWGLGYFSEVRSGIDKGLARERSEDLLLQDALWKLRAGKAMDARAALEEALKVNPSDLRALQTLKQTYDGQKDAGAALQKVQQYADRQPKSAPVQDFVGVLLMAKGDRVKARAAFEAAKAADPQYVAAEMSLVQVDILENKVDDARKRLEAITSRNNNVVARSWLGNIYEIRNDHGAAIEQYRKVVASNPNDGEASNNLAYLLTEYGNRADEALQYAQKAVELAPKEAAYCDTLGWVLYHKGLYSAAIPYLERANSARVVPVSAYHLAMAYAKAGETKRGRATLEAALKNSPNLPEAKMAQEVLGISR